MKITKQQLKRIIKEEITKLNEGPMDGLDIAFSNLNNYLTSLDSGKWPDSRGDEVASMKAIHRHVFKTPSNPAAMESINYYSGRIMEFLRSHGQGDPQGASGFFRQLLSKLTLAMGREQ